MTVDNFLNPNLKEIGMVWDDFKHGDVPLYECQICQARTTNPKECPSCAKKEEFCLSDEICGFSDTPQYIYTPDIKEFIKRLKERNDLEDDGSFIPTIDALAGEKLI